MGGKELHKSILVTTNDVNMANFRLEVVGQVEKFVTISPTSVVRLNGKVGTPIITEIRIIQEKQHPFKIKDIKAKKGEFIRWKIKEEKNTKPVEYILTVENVKKEAGRYFDTLTITTDSEERSAFDLRVFGQINDSKDDPKEAIQSSRRFRNDNS